MTNNQLTRERIELIANFHRAMMLPPSHDEIEELARMALAAMDSEPVAYAWVSHSGKKHLTRCEPEQWRDAVIVTPLYRHGQTAPVVRIGPKINSKMFNADVIFGYEKGRKEVIENIKAAGIEVENE